MTAPPAAPSDSLSDSPSDSPEPRRLHAVCGLFDLAADPPLAALAAGLRDRIDGCPLRIAEAAIDGRFVAADDGDDLRLPIDASHRLWQKEALLNAAIATLPAEIDAVAWIDADLTLPPGWAERTLAALRRFPIVQLFGAVRHESPTGVRERPGLVAARRGTPGHAWAARREAIEAGLFDLAILGGGDSLMHHAWTGRTGGASLTDLPPTIRERFVAWAKQAWCPVRGRVGWVDQTITHHWHGPPRRRHPADRGRRLYAAGFDLDRHLVRDRGLWRWTPAADPVRRVVADYFAERTKDAESNGGGRASVRRLAEGDADQPRTVPTVHADRESNAGVGSGRDAIRSVGSDARPPEIRSPRPVVRHLCNLPRRDDRLRRALWGDGYEPDRFDWPGGLELVTYSNRRTAGPLEMQAARRGWPCVTLGRDRVRWRNADKIALTLAHLKRSRAQYVLACDNDDAQILADPQTAIAELERRELDVLFGAESHCYPPQPAMRAAQDALVSGPHRYLNSGQAIMHRERAIGWYELAARQPAARVAASDQDRWHPVYVAHPDRIGIDSGRRAFAVISAADASDAERLPPVTLCLLSWRRPSNIVRILAETLPHPLVSDAIVWSNAPAQPVPLESTLPPALRDRVTLIASSRDVGLRSRWHAAAVASESLLLIQDDDFLLPADTVTGLVASSYADPDRLHGVEGRRPERTDDPARPIRYHARPAYGRVPMLLGHGLTMPRALACDLVAEEPRFVHAAGYRPDDHGDDIFYSYASTALLGRCPRAEDRERISLPAPHRLSGRAGHRAKRERLIADCERFFRLR